MSSFNNAVSANTTDARTVDATSCTLTAGRLESDGPWVNSLPWAHIYAPAGAVGQLPRANWHIIVIDDCIRGARVVLGAIMTSGSPGAQLAALACKESRQMQDGEWSQGSYL